MELEPPESEYCYGEDRQDEYPVPIGAAWACHQTSPPLRVTGLVNVRMPRPVTMGPQVHPGLVNGSPGEEPVVGQPAPLIHMVCASNSGCAYALPGVKESSHSH